MLDAHHQAMRSVTSPFLFPVQKGPAIAAADAAKASHASPWQDANVMSGVFAAGTLIDTPTGKVAIETLTAGDAICSFKNGKIAVHRCVAVPDQCIPDQVVRIRSGYLNAKADLFTLPQQPVRLDHWLGSALFATKFPFVTISQVRLDEKIENVLKSGMQFFRLFIGVCDAITANGALCIADKSGGDYQVHQQNRFKNFDFKSLDSKEIRQALDAGGFFRKAKSKASSQST